MKLQLLYMIISWSHKPGNFVIMYYLGVASALSRLISPTTRFLLNALFGLAIKYIKAMAGPFRQESIDDRLIPRLNPPWNIMSLWNCIWTILSHCHSLLSYHLKSSIMQLNGFINMAKLLTNPDMLPSVLTLLMLKTEYSGLFGQHLACWCPGALSRQGISGNDIDSMG